MKKLLCKVINKAIDWFEGRTGWLYLALVFSPLLGFGFMTLLYWVVIWLFF